MCHVFLCHAELKPRRGSQIRGNWSEEAPRAIPPYRDYLFLCYQDDGCLLQGFACTHMQAPCEVSPPERSLHEIQGSSETFSHKGQGLSLSLSPW